MKIDELYEHAQAAEQKYYCTAAHLSGQEASMISGFKRHARDNFMELLDELRRLNKEIAAYADSDDAELPQCTDTGTMMQFEEVDL